MTDRDEVERLWRARDLLKQAQLALPVSGVGTYDPANKAISRAMRRVDKQIARLTVAWVQRMGAPATLPVPKRTVGPRFGDHAELLGSFVTRERPIIGEPGIVRSTPEHETFTFVVSVKHMDRATARWALASALDDDFTITDAPTDAHMVVVDNGDIEPELWAFANLDDAATFAEARGANPEFIQTLPVLDRTGANEAIEREDA